MITVFRPKDVTYSERRILPRFLNEFAVFGCINILAQIAEFFSWLRRLVTFARRGAGRRLFGSGE